MVIHAFFGKALEVCCLGEIAGCALHGIAEKLVVEFTKNRFCFLGTCYVLSGLRSKSPCDKVLSQCKTVGDIAG